MENSLSCFRLAQCYVTINSVKQQWQHFIRSLDSERRKRQHLKNQVQWYVRRESKHLSVPTTCEVECSSQCSVSDTMPYSYQASLPQRLFSGAVAHDFGSLHRKRKAPEVSPRQCVRDRSLSVETSGSINDSPTAVPERPKIQQFFCPYF